MKDEFYAGKVAVVTGAGGTLCSVIAADLADKGCKVVLIGRTRSKLEKTEAAILAKGGECMIKTCDVLSESEMTRIAAEVMQELGPCRFLVNGAGGNNMKARTTKSHFDADDMTDDPEKKTSELKGFWDLDMPTFEQVLQTNTTGTVIAIKAFCRDMIAAGGGSILNFASMNTYCPLTGNPAYAMGKAAIANFTQWSGAYFAPAGVRINAVAPGFFVNERSIAYLGSPETGLTKRGEKVIDHTPQGRFGQPVDLLGTVDFLLDDRKSAFVTGVTIPVDGGFLTLSGV